MKKLSTLVLIFTISLSHALDPMHNYRYTLGPEILVPDQFFASLGGWTHRNEDLSISANVQLGLTDKLEIGMKYIGGTKDDWIVLKDSYRNHSYSLIDLGAKYAISSHMALQVDIPISLNRDRDWGGVISLAEWKSHTKNVSSLYEGRIGFGGASGPGNYAKLSAAYIPYFQLGSALRISVCAVTSASPENFSNDFMFDIQPRVEAGFATFRVMTEVSLGILTYDAEKHTRFALFVMSDI